LVTASEYHATLRRNETKPQGTNLNTEWDWQSPLVLRLRQAMGLSFQTWQTRGHGRQTRCIATLSQSAFCHKNIISQKQQVCCSVLSVLPCRYSQYLCHNVSLPSSSMPATLYCWQHKYSSITLMYQ